MRREQSLTVDQGVELCYDQISEVFKKSVRYELSRRGTTHLSICEVLVSPRHNLDIASIHKALDSGKSPSLEKILQKFSTQEDGG